MTRFIAVAILVFITANISVTPSIVACAEEQKLAPEGRGLLPKPAGPMPQEQLTRPYAFKADPSGGLSRTVFQTDEDPNFRVIVRDFSFPPDRQRHILTLTFGALVDIPLGPAEISIDKKTLNTPGARVAVPAGAPIEILNSGEYPVALRAIIVEPK
jgi:hypothetical protein